MDQTDHQQLNSLEFRDPFYRLEPSLHQPSSLLLSSLSPASHTPGAEHVWERGEEGGGEGGCKQVQVNKLQDNVSAGQTG